MSFIKALEIIRDNEINMPRDLAEKLWPDSDGWKRVHRVGHGVSCGAMMAFAAGGLLGKLRQKNYIGVFYPVRLKPAGEELLAQPPH